MNGRFAARLYAPHLPSAGIAVDATFVGNRLHVEGSDAQQVDANAITVHIGGFDHDQLQLCWTAMHDHAAVQWALTPVDAAARATALGTAPAALEPALRKFRRRGQRMSAKWWLLGGTAATLVLAIVAAWWSYGALLDWAASRVPPEVEAKLGEATVSELRKAGRLIDKGPAVDAVTEIGNKLTAGSRYQYHWAVLDEASINAFAAPGGHVVVHRGLIEAAKTPEELAGVLAHEVQHIEQRHTLKAMMNGVGWAALSTAVLGDVSAMVGVLAYQVGTLSYSRDLEAEADRLGLAALVKADIAPGGMVDFFRTLEKEGEKRGNAAPIALLSSHPATDSRIAAIEADLAKLPAKTYPPLAIDWPAVQASFGNDKGDSDAGE